MRNKVNDILVEQIKLFNLLQDSLENQRECLKNNKIFELDSISVKINEICKNIAEFEMKLRKLLGERTIKSFIAENNSDKELQDSYIFLVSQVERLNLIKSDNQFLIKKSLNFMNKLLSSIGNNPTKSNVYSIRKTSF